MPYEQLEKLDELRQKGIITDDEFQAEKARLLGGAAGNAIPAGEKRYWGMELNSFCMLMHLASLGNFLVPFGGLILQIVMWATQKGESDTIDIHGKIVLNWYISLFIYSIISVLLIFVIIGIPLLIALFICDLVFAIMGAVKANNGVVWRYPLSIRFLG